MSEKLIELNEMRTHFSTENGQLTALDGISFHINEGEILGVVGESGCGKSATAHSIMRLNDENTTTYEGEVNFQNRNLFEMSKSEMRHIRGNDISMIFQDPMSSLDPVYTIGDQIVETILLHQDVSKAEARKKAIELLELTGIPDPNKRIDEYPHQLSGGMRQRILIAIALSCRPKLLVADEPTTALDVTIQAQILDLILDMNEERQMGIMFITHDLGVVAEVCSRVIVMYLGQVVEEATVEELFTSPFHPYTKGLIKSIPQLDGDRSQKMHTIEGAVPPLDKIPQGCRFAPRCPFADELCRTKMPDLQVHNDNHKVRCWHYDEIARKETETNGRANSEQGETART